MRLIIVYDCNPFTMYDTCPWNCVTDIGLSVVYSYILKLVWKCIQCTFCKLNFIYTFIMAAPISIIFLKKIQSCTVLTIQISLSFIPQKYISLTLKTQQNSNKKFSLQMSTCVSYIAWTYSTVILLLANVYFYKYRIHKFTCTFLCDGLSG